MVSPPLYGSEPMARSSAGRVRCSFRLNSVRVSLLYWTTPTLVLSSPIWKAPATAEIKLRMYLKFGLPTLQEPSTRNTTSAMALTGHSGKRFRSEREWRSGQEIQKEEEESKKNTTDKNTLRYFRILRLKSIVFYVFIIFQQKKLKILWRYCGSTEKDFHELPGP